MQRISESVFVGLCHKLGTAQQVAMRRDIMEIIEMVRNQKAAISGSTGSLLSGSQREGFRLKESDYDMMLWRVNHRVIWELSQSQYYNTHRQTLILCDCSDSPPGFTLLYLLSPSMLRKVQYACVRMNNRHYISSSKYRQIVCALPTSEYLSPHGPCASGSIGPLEYDIAHCFVSDFWPPSASSWKDRCNSWPHPNIVDDIVQNGCHFVAIGHKLGRNEGNEWRISFSLAENKLVYAMNHCQFLTYGLLKLFLTEIINNGLSAGNKLLCSYHMKTAVFWVIQQNTIPHWCPQNLLECFWVCFKLILKWVYEGVCPNFFIPANNMFLGNIHGAAQKHLFIRLHGLYEKGFVFLLHSPSIRSSIITALYNPRHSIRTEEHTQISEKELDMELFTEIQKNDIIFMFKAPLQNCTRDLQAIEQVISAHPMTQYQIIMLQRFTTSILQNLAFILQMKTCASENKLMYRADKILCHMLKLAAKFGCISDMLYIAMYYYKTLRYKKALSIIDVVKVKLAHPCVIYNSNVDAEMYIETVGGQPLSTKMKQAVAQDIKLENLIYYICELIPEQQSGLEDTTFFLSVPLFVLLHMLEILCYRQIDTIRAQTALDDLQTLVHYDQGQFVYSDLRDISWQILGICQQLTGNLQDAWYSYQRSLRQRHLINRIQKATIMRIQNICQ
ncbi:uncharacterized protein LOC133191806 [Saccostrea echinata]|uniref:uncharacterized protein LOC133191806 n=1 Tax=Saccostrea echinata TaxID=191078 RepID=UPI002A82C289|nr:uncharacterized protein LOC133191806 [Saccostrea echinata]